MKQTAQEQESNLWIASRKYITGEIEIDELERIERIESEHLKNAVRLLAKRSITQDLLERFFFRKKKAPSLPS